MWWAAWFWVDKEREMSCKECPRCKRAWPPNPDFNVCAFCEVATVLNNNRQCMAPERADKLLGELHLAERDFENDWAAAEAVAQAHDLDVADLLVAKRPRPEAA